MFKISSFSFFNVATKTFEIILVTYIVFFHWIMLLCTAASPRWALPPGNPGVGAFPGLLAPLGNLSNDDGPVTQHTLQLLPPLNSEFF